MKLTLTVLTQRFAVGKISVEDPIPSWLYDCDFFAITKTPEELSLVYIEEGNPPLATCSGGWRGLKVEGPLDFSEIGILSTLSSALANEEISIFAVSTFDTDYLFVKEETLARAIIALKKVATVNE